MLLTIIAFLFVLGVIVLVHELGHFATARKFGIKVDEFGLGIPPRLVGIYKDQNGKWRFVGMKANQAEKTIWSLNWIPLGGFVKIKGESGEFAGEADSFGTKKAWQRIVVLSAGVTMNIILAAALLSILFAIGTPQVISERELPAHANIENQQVRVVEVLPESPAAQAEIVVADAIISVNDQTITSIEQLQQAFSDQENKLQSLVIERNGEKIETQVTPEVLAETNQTGIGVGLVEVADVSYPWYISWWYGIKETFVLMWGVLYGFYTVIKSLLFSGEVVGEVYGPVGIASLIGDAARLGFLYLLQFTAVLSVIIAVINFLPFPALDGGRVLFVVIEKIRRKPVDQKLEALMHNIGFALLMALVVLVTFKDVSRLTGGFASLGEKIMSLF